MPADLTPHVPGPGYGPGSGPVSGPGLPHTPEASARPEDAPGQGATVPVRRPQPGAGARPDGPIRPTLPAAFRSHPTVQRTTVVTLTSIPPRFAHLPARFRAIARQTMRPARVQLTLPRQYRRFPGERPTLPPLPDWVEVFECDHDFGPATKLLPAVRRWAGTPTDLLVCDDDRRQDRNWIARLTAARAARPDAIVCERGWSVDDRFALRRSAPVQPRARPAAQGGRTVGYRLARALSLGLLHPDRKLFAKAGHVDVFEGFLGAIIPVEAVPERAFDIPEVLWTVDDVWISGMAATRGTMVWVHDTPRPVHSDGPVDRIHALRHHTERGIGRDDADRLAVEWFRDRYGIWT